jgi:hypothetical protein
VDLAKEKWETVPRTWDTVENMQMIKPDMARAADLAEWEEVGGKVR